MIIESLQSAVVDPNIDMDRYFSKISVKDLKPSIPLIAATEGLTLGEVNSWKGTQIRNAMVGIMNSAEKLKVFIGYLPDSNRNLLESVIWEMDSKVSYFEEKLDCTLLFNNNKSWGPARDRFTVNDLFDIPYWLIWEINNSWTYSSRSGNYVCLNFQILSRLKEVLGRPEDYDLDILPATHLEKMKIWKNENIFAQLEILKQAAKEKTFQFKQDGFISASDGKKLVSILDLEKFPAEESFSDFPSKIKPVCRQWQVRHWSLILDCFYRFPEKFNSASGLSSLQKIFEFLSTQNLPWIVSLNNHLKRLDIFNTTLKNNKPFNDVFAKLSTMESQQWYSHGSIIRQLTYNGFVDWIPHKGSLRNSSYYDPYDKYFDVSHVDIYNSLSVVEIPLANALLFFMAQMGLVEMAYTQDKIKNPKEMSAYQLPSTLMHAFRLTPLGEFMTGKISQDTWEKQFSFKIKKEEPVEFSSTQYLIRYRGNNPLTHSKLKDIAKPLKDGFFHVTTEGILAKCKDADALDDILHDIESLSDSPLPQNWKTFFESLPPRVCEMEMKSTPYYIITIADQPELLRKLSRVKWLTKNAELLKGGRILIPGQLIEKLSSEIRKQGYIPNIDEQTLDMRATRY